MRTPEQTHNGLPSTSCEESAEQLRDREFSRLGKQTYVDHAGAALYSEAQLRDVFQDLSTKVYGNPHSQHAQLSGSVVDTQAQARQLTLDMCSASPADYECIFTSGATGGVKLIADTFPWSPHSCFAYTRDNHTSVLGARAVALQAGASAAVVDAHLSPHGAWRVEPCAETMRRSGTVAQSGFQAKHLFAYPLESNFSGARYDPALSTYIQRNGLPVCEQQSAAVGAGTHKQQVYPMSNGTARNGRHASDTEAADGGRSDCGGTWWTLLDAAKACATRPPDLSQHKPDFVVLSYYKIFGYPTGLGALLVRREAKAALDKAYFGGGTVSACSAESDFVRRREGPAGFEDGTTSYLGIASLPHGFRLLQRLGGLGTIQAHTQQLTRALAGQLTDLRHFNGSPVCQLYGRHGRSADHTARQPGIAVLPGTVGQGPTIALNLLRADGSFVGYREVEKMAGLSGILLRTGCFCNPGACAAHLGLSAADIQENFEAGHVCWDDNDLIDGRPTGAVRVSFGLSSTAGDAAAVLDFVRLNFLQSRGPLAPLQRGLQDQTQAGAAADRAEKPRLAGIWVYPVKSCAGCSQEAWPLGPNGLLYDREWALVGEDNQVLTLKRHPQLAFLQPQLDLSSGIMTVTAPGMPHALKLPLPKGTHLSSEACSGGAKAKESSAGLQRQILICADSVCSMQVASSLSASDWFSQAVGQRCTLVQQQAGSRCSVQRHWLQSGQDDAATAASSPSSIGFANEAQMALINQASLDDLNRRLRAKRAQAGVADRALEDVSADRFRPNLVVNGATAFAEDQWERLAVGSYSQFEVAGPCARCEVICVDPAKGERQGAEPLLTLAQYRRTKGRINFGVLLQNSRSMDTRGQAHVIAVGMCLTST